MSTASRHITKGTMDPSTLMLYRSAPEHECAPSQRVDQHLLRLILGQRAAWEGSDQQHEHPADG